MTAYSFQPRFVAPILAGTKQQTIRAERKRHGRPGEELQLYTGMRTKRCRLIGRANCFSVWPITIDIERREIEYADRIISLQQDLDAFARTDGFADWWEMRDFWKEAHRKGLTTLSHDNKPWRGVLIRWTDFSPA